MRKTFLKVALIGLLVGSLPVGFTSCKDYDDIQNLENQTSDLKSQLGTLQSALADAQSAAQSAASQAQAAAAKADDALAKAAAATAAAEQAKADAIVEAVKQVEALAATTATKEDLTKLGSEIAAIDEDLNKLTTTVDENTKNIAALQLQMKTLEGFQTILGPLVENFGTPEKVEALMKDLESARELVDQLNTALPEGTSLAELVQSISKISPNLVTLQSTVAAMVTHAELVYAKQLWIPSLQVETNEIAGYWKWNEETEQNEWVTYSAGYYDINAGKWVETGDPVYYGYAQGTWTSLNTTNLDLDLGFSTAAVDYEFGTSERPATKFNQTIANPIKFEKGKQLVFEDAIMVRVTPTNAVITPEQISLINTQLGDLSEFIAVSKVEKYDGLLSRGAKDNGLWTITLTLKPGYDQDAFADATWTAQGKQILYALAIGHKATGNESVDADFADRCVTTAYDITFSDKAKAPVYALDYFVGNIRVGHIHNRYEYADETDKTNWYPSLVYATNAVTNPANNMIGVYDKAQVVERYTAGYAVVGDYTWGINADTKALQYQVADSWNWNTPVLKYSYKGATYSLPSYYNDNRQGAGKAKVEVGKPFTVTIPYENAYAFYVALDLDRAIVSNGSERNAWESYVGKITGLNTITTEGSIDLTITDAAKVAQGEVIGFRVWAVNYDGTLIDPDGRAFYVQVGQEAAATATMTANITAPRLDINPGNNGVNLINIASELGSWTNQPEVNVSFKMNTQSNPTTSSNVSVVLGTGDVIPATGINYQLTRNNVTGADADYNAYFKGMNVQLGDYKFVDGKTYTGTLTITDKNGLVLQTIAVNVTKNLPASIPSAIAPIAGQIANGEGTAYVTTNSFDFNSMFNGLKATYTTATGSDLATLEMKGGDKKFGETNAQTVTFPAGNQWNGADFVNKGTQFSLIISFNYGEISLPAKGAAMAEVTRKATYSIDFATQANTINFAWNGNAPALVDGQAKNVSTDAITLSSIFKKFNGNLTASMVDNYISNVSVKLTGDIAKYFEVDIEAPTKKTAGNNPTNGKLIFTPIEGTNPTTSTVTGKVEITYYDTNATAFKSVKTLNIQMD